MRKLVLLLLVSCFKLVLVAQSEPEDDFHRVMIIPFDPNMYFSDADKDLAEYNDKSIKEIRTMFRYGLNVNLNARILSEYESRPLLTDTTHGAMDDLYAIYKGIRYYQDKSMPAEHLMEESQEDTGEKKKLFRRKNEEDGDEANATSKLKKEMNTKAYMNVRIVHQEMLTFLKQKYGTDLFLFINQFDLVTDYEHCLDRATKTYERDIRVHFSVFDYTGKQLAGDVAIVHFPSNSNDMIEIMRSNFPVISEYLASNLPRKVSEEETQYEKDMKYLEELKGEN